MSFSGDSEGEEEGGGRGGIAFNILKFSWPSNLPCLEVSWFVLGTASA